MRLMGFITMTILLRARELVRLGICPIDLYSSSTMFNIASPTREHVVPKSLLKGSRGAYADLNNIFVCTSMMNSWRGRRAYGNVLAPKIILDGRTGFDVENHLTVAPADLCRVGMCERFEPPSHAKGPIARTCLYMEEKYPSIAGLIATRVLHPDTAHEWHERYTIKDWEKKRRELLAKMGYPLNPYLQL